MTKLDNINDSMEETSAKQLINNMMEHALGTIDKFRADVAAENSSPTFIIEWSGRIIEAEFMYAKFSLILKRIDRMTVSESIQIAAEGLEEQLLDNYFSANSTSPIHNGIKSAQGSAASSLLRTCKTLLVSLNTPS